MSNKTAAQRVLAGVALLQSLESCCSVPHLGSSQTVPSDWKSRIDLADLDLGDSSLCILGQVFGSYDNGLKKIGLELDFVKSRDKGFESGSGSYDNYVSSSELTTEWKKFLRGKKIGPEARKVGSLLRHSAYGSVVLRLVQRVDQGDREFWVVEKMSVDSMDTLISTEDFVLRSGETLDENYKPFFEPTRIVAGRIYKAPDNTLFYAETTTKLWKLSAVDGATWCDVAYFEGKHGKLKELTTLFGDVLSDAMKY